MNIGGVTNGARLPLRWVALVTGARANMDYQPTASDGEPATLVAEVKDICKAFHPHSALGQFPTNRAVWLYWVSKTTGDFVITRVSVAPNPEGSRLALEYYSLLLDRAGFDKLQLNPFLARDWGLHDRIKQQQGNGARPVTEVDLPFPATARMRSQPQSVAARSQSPQTMVLGTEMPPTAENLQNLESRVAQVASLGSLPPTFVTWWASGAALPAGYFDIVLRANPKELMRLSDVRKIAMTLGRDIKTYLPNAPTNDGNAKRLTDSLLADTDSLFNLIREVEDVAQNPANHPPDRFRVAVSEAAGLLTRMGSDLESLVRRVFPDTGSENAQRLLDLSHQCATFAADLPTLRNPNPFGARPEAGGRAAQDGRRAPAAALSIPIEAVAGLRKAVTPGVHPKPAEGRTSPRDTAPALPTAAQSAAVSSADAPPAPEARRIHPALIAVPVGCAGLAVVWAALHRAPAAPPPANTHPTSSKATPVKLSHSSGKGAVSVAVGKPLGSTPVSVSQPNTTEDALTSKRMDLLDSNAAQAEKLARNLAYQQAYHEVFSRDGLSRGAEVIVARTAIKDAYRQLLSPADFHMVFAGDEKWYIDTYEKLFNGSSLHLDKVQLAAHKGAMKHANTFRTETSIAAGVAQHVSTPSRTHVSVASHENSHGDAAGKRSNGNGAAVKKAGTERSAGHATGHKPDHNSKHPAKHPAAKSHSQQGSADETGL